MSKHKTFRKGQDKKEQDFYRDSLARDANNNYLYDPSISNKEDEYIPSEEEEYMNERQLEYFKKKLIEWKHNIQKNTLRLKNHLENSRLHDPDAADRASMELDVFYELNNQERDRKLIAKIDAALQKIEDKEYGYCEDTGKEIGVRRLNARLIATLCIEAQEIRERKNKDYNNNDDKDMK